MKAGSSPAPAKAGGKKKKRRRRRQASAPPEVLAVRGDLSGRLLNTLWHTPIGRSRREALLTELASQIPDKRIDGQLDRLVDAYDLQFWLKHYARSRRVWAELNGQTEQITLLGIDLFERQVKFLDAQLQERALPVDEVKLVDEEEREIRQQRTLMAKFDARHTAIVRQLERVETGLATAAAEQLGAITARVRGISVELNKLRHSRNAIAQRVSVLEEAAKERRHKATTILGVVSEEELRRAVPSA